MQQYTDLVYRQFSFQTLTEQEKILDALQISNRDSQKLQSDMQLILQHITNGKPLSDQIKWQEILRQDVIRQIYNDNDSAHSEYAKNIVLPSETRIKMEKNLLAALAYTDMEERQEQVAIAFETTFQWALTKLDSQANKWKSLTTWFEGQEQIFWISGKAGSGKSTLIKFLSYGDSKSYPFLKKWAGNKDLITAAFYFWASDPGPMQKSHSGIFRTLLHRILDLRPDLAPTVFPSRWEALAIAGVHPELNEWTQIELHDCLIRAITALGTKDVCICLFIDGLDEFDGHPKPTIELLHELAGLGKHVKLCVASRPWIEYRTNFASLPQLQLQDLTYDDIKLFVTSKLQNHPEFIKLRLREAAFADQLIENIISKASGVFLWVSLVVSSLLLGLTEGDRIRDLQKSLDALPPGLNNLYERILEGLLKGDDQRNNENRAEMIMLMESSDGALPLLTFSFAEEGSLHWLRSLPKSPMAEDNVLGYTKSTRMRLLSRWRGLLEVGRPSVDSSHNGQTHESERNRSRMITVHYLHRTVREFVHGEKMTNFIKKERNPRFDPHLQLCIAYCACTIAVNSVQFPERLAFRHARQISKDRQSEMVEILAQMPHTDAPQAISMRQISSSLTEHQEKMAEVAMLKTAAAEGVLSYLVTKLGRNRDQELLNQMLAAAVESPSTNHETVCWLLERGANPNYSEAFSRFKKHINECDTVSSLSALEEGMRRCLISFVAHGSGINIIRLEYWNRGESSIQKQWPASMYEELRKILVRPVPGVGASDDAVTSDIVLDVKKPGFMKTLHGYLPSWTNRHS